MTGGNQTGPEGARGVTGPAGVLRLNRRVFAPGQLLVMAIVNQTPDSRYRPGASWDRAAAMERVQALVAEGADIVDLGGAPARPRADLREEIGRTAAFVAAVRDAHPELVICVDTRRHEVGRQACAAGADLLYDGRGGWDGRLAKAAAEFGAGLVCSPAGQPRTRPSRAAAGDVMDDVLALAARAAEAGVEAARILIGPAPGSGANTRPSRETTRRLADLAATGWPVLVCMTDEDPAGAADHERLAGTLAATAVCAWLGARVFRVHRVRETRHVLTMVSAIRGDVPPARAVRGLA